MMNSSAIKIEIEEKDLKEDIKVKKAIQKKFGTMIERPSSQISHTGSNIEDIENRGEFPKTAGHYLDDLLKVLHLMFNYLKKLDSAGVTLTHILTTYKS